LAIVASVCLANAFSCFNATVVAFGHCGIMILKDYLFLSQLVRLGEGIGDAASRHGANCHLKSGEGRAALLRHGPLGFNVSVPGPSR
jgi:hypothetical protein